MRQDVDKYIFYSIVIMSKSMNFGSCECFTRKT